MNTYTSLNICGVPTTIITRGKGITEISSNKNVPQDLILIIPGNPGYVTLYEEFLEEIYNRLGIPVWIIGHAGHEPKTNSKGLPVLTGNESLYNLDGQIVHKQTFIEKYVPENVRLHLVGHSIGPYMILQLLKLPTIRSKVAGSYFLFPTIEKMAESPKGQSFVATMKHQRWILLLIKIFALLPLLLKSLLMEILGTIFSTPKRYRKLYIDLLDPTMTKKVFLLADHEMVAVKERDTDTLKANKDKIKFYYGYEDGWTPKSYYTELQRDIPGIDIELGAKNYKHSFLSRHSKELGNLVADWIQKRRQ